MKKIKTYLIVILISVVFTLYLFEGYLTFNDARVGSQLTKVEKLYLYKEQTGKEYDTRTKLQIYEDLKESDENVVIVFDPQFNSSIAIHSLSGISNSKTILCNENGYFSIYQSDRYGFNNPDDEWDQQDIEYFLIGDSFVHGACVNRPNDIGSVLRTLSKKSVLNLGYSGIGPLLEYATLREYLRPNVKSILWIYYEGNDIYDLKNELNSQLLIKYLENLNFSQNLKFKQNQINEMGKSLLLTREKTLRSNIVYHQEKKSKLKYKILKFIRLDKLKKALFKKNRLIVYKEIQKTQQFKRILKLANDLASKNNSRLYFVYLPEYVRYKSYFYNLSYHSVKKIVNELNIPFIDIRKEVFEKEDNPLTLFPFETPDFHYNVYGYRKIAEAIHQIISK